MTCIEIEDYDGNTIGAILIDKDIKIADILSIEGFDIADKDVDDIFNTDGYKIRIQQDHFR